MATASTKVNESLSPQLGAGSIQAVVLAAPVTVCGFYVGSRAAFETMIRAVSARKARPVIDSAFEPDEAHDADRHSDSGSAVGKVVIGG